MEPSTQPTLSIEGFVSEIQTAQPIIQQRLLRHFGDPQLAEELSWDSMTKAYQILKEQPDYFVGRNLVNWGTRDATWRALDELRYRNRFVCFASEDEEENYTGGVPHPAVDDTAQVAEQLQQLVWDSLQQLPKEEHRHVLESYYFDDLTDCEIGAELYGDAISPQAGGLRAYRCRQKAQVELGKVLRQNGYDPEEGQFPSQQAV